MDYFRKLPRRNRAFPYIVVKSLAAYLLNESTWIDLWFVFEFENVALNSFGVDPSSLSIGVHDAAAMLPADFWSRIFPKPCRTNDILYLSVKVVSNLFSYFL